jgi:hypothetical protein
MTSKMTQLGVKKRIARANGVRGHARICAYAYPCHTHMKGKEMEERARG